MMEFNWNKFKGRAFKELRHEHPDDRPKPTPPKSKRRAERSQPSMNIRPAELNWNKYIVACVICKSTGNLCMIGQRSKEEIVAPWVFICENCFELVKNKKICIDFKNHGHSKEDGR